MMFTKSLSLRRFFLVLTMSYLLVLSGHLKADDVDGKWELKITGVDKLEVGSEFLAGGLTVNWSVTLLFTIKNGAFFSGTGVATLDKNIQQYSRPEGMFNCENIPGTFVSKNGLLFETPHLRYVSFPLVGQTQLKKQNEAVMLKLVHGMTYPGNFYGVLFECKTDNDLGLNWLERSPRISKEKGSRQSMTTSKENNLYTIKVKQVKSVAPGAELVIPLINQWKASMSDSFGETHLEYHLIKK